MTKIVQTAILGSDARLGKYERYSYQAIVDQVTGTSPTLTVQQEHSSDERNWSNRNGTAEINGVSLSPSRDSASRRRDTA